MNPIRSGGFEQDGLKGYFMAFHDGVNENVCVVASSPQGEMLALRHSGPDCRPEDAVAGIAESAQNARADMRWAFSMADADALPHLADALGIPHVEREAALEALSAIVSGMSRTSLDGLDRPALEALSGSPAKRLGSYAFYRGEGERPTRRRQAAAAYPVLADFMAANLSTKMAIDRSQPLADALAAALSGFVDSEIGKAVIKRLAHAGEIPDGCSLETVARFMAAVPADWIPAGGPEWEAFCSVAHGLLEDLGVADSDVPSLVRGCSGKWVEFCERVSRKGGHEDAGPAAFRAVMSAASEMSDCFATVCVLPLAAHASPVSTVTVTPEIMHRSAAAARSMLLEGRSASEVADLQRRWHQERAGILDGTRVLQDERNAILRGNVEEGGWPALTDTVQAPNGLWLVPLTNPSELSAEGAGGPDANGVPGLSHCVGSYSTKAKSCDCHIVSVREIDGNGAYRRLSTAEFGAVQPGSDRLSLRQNKALGNGAPAAAALDAVNWYMASVAGGLLQINRAQISAFLDSGMLPEDGVERMCGYDWKERDLLNAAVAPWGRFVGPAFKGKTLDDVMDSEQVSALVALVPPEILLSPAR